MVPIKWIVVYPKDSAIHPLNNWGLENSSTSCGFKGQFALKRNVRFEKYSDNLRVYLFLFFSVFCFALFCLGQIYLCSLQRKLLKELMAFLFKTARL